MRQLEFRAWDKTAKEMREVAGIDFQYRVIGYFFDEDVESLDFSETVLMQYTGIKDKNGVEINEGDIVKCKNYHEDVKSLDFSEIELMQYIGLKDKNGVEIYEGDIVCMHNFYGGFEDKIDVIGIVGINEMGTYTETEDDKLFWLNYWVEPEEELEVIGNIYEHPELIKESKYE